MWTSKGIAAASLLLLTSPISGQDSKRFALLPSSESYAVTDLCSRKGPKVDASWAPTKDDIQTLEIRLSRISKLRSRQGLIGIRIANPSSYYRQYVGIMVGARKLIYVNAFNDSDVPSYWHERLVNVCDGGTAAWGALYDPETHEFSELRTNG